MTRKGFIQRKLSQAEGFVKPEDGRAKQVSVRFRAQALCHNFGSEI